MRVYLGTETVELDPGAILGTGGEADVYRISAGRALKLFKRPDHPDNRGDPAAEAAARARLDLHQTKLRGFPAGLPERVVAPLELAMSKRGGKQIVGYSMRCIDGADLLYRFSEPRVRRAGLSTERIIGALRDLWTTVSALHDAGVVIGDFNDLNVLVDGQRCYLIDADSYQFGSYPCTVFNERFVDPLVCDPSASGLVMTRPHSADSDWYAFAIILMRSLLCVGPYGGVYRPADRSKRVSRGARPLHRITVFNRDVVYPKPAIHYRVLPDALLHYLTQAFEQDERGAIPRALLDTLRFTRCSACGAEHARAVCPVCTKRGTLPKPKLCVRGQVTAEVVFETRGRILDAAAGDRTVRWVEWREGALWREDGARLGEVAGTSRTRVVRHGDGALVGDGGRVRLLGVGGRESVLAADLVAGDTIFGANARHHYLSAGGSLVRSDLYGDKTLGAVLAGQTRFWVGERFGFGFYRAGRLEVSFTFDARRPGLADGVQRLALRGALLDAHCVVGADVAWLFLREEVAGQRATRCLLIDRSGAVIAARAGATDPSAFLEAGRSACAVGRFLFVATDEGLVRVERDGDALRVTRTYPDTEPFVDAACRLVVCPDGMYVVATHHITRLTLR